MLESLILGQLDMLSIAQNKLIINKTIENPRKQVFDVIELFRIQLNSKKLKI